MSHLRVLLTGATGFIGTAVLKGLVEREGCETVVVLRRAKKLPVEATTVWISSLLLDADWRPSLAGIDVVLHAAARAHVINDFSTDSLAEFRTVNVDGALNLARHAAASGVRRFVFISSIKVNGEGTKPGDLYTADDVPAPTDPYGVSKAEAEEGLLQLARVTGMEVVIVRPVLVYGPGVKGNFASMARMVWRGVPLPLGAVHNQRSFVALDNLVDFLVLCADRDRSPAAANQVFVISDGEDVSTTRLLRRVAEAQGRSARLLPVPVSWLRFAARVLGKQAVADRLLGNLQVDASKARELLGWRPVVTMEQQLAKMYSENGNA